VLEPFSDISSYDATTWHLETLNETAQSSKASRGYKPHWENVKIYFYTLSMLHKQNAKSAHAPSGHESKAVYFFFAKASRTGDREMTPLRVLGLVLRTKIIPPGSESNKELSCSSATWVFFGRVPIPLSCWRSTEDCSKRA
jgi:hypothetical protein